MAVMDTQENVFQLPINIEANGIVTKTLATADTYVDKNIKVTVTTPDAEFEIKDEGQLTATIDMSTTGNSDFIQDTATKYAVAIKAQGHKTAEIVGTKTAGFTASTDTVTIAADDSEIESKTVYLKEGALGGSGEVEIDDTNVEVTLVGEKPSSGFYVHANATGSVGVTTAGWVDPDDVEEIDTDADAYYTIQSGSLSNTGAGEYTELSAPVLTSGGYLFINEGYFANSKVSLATLVPDVATVTNTDSPYIYKTITAYDKDGTLIAGTLDDATLSAITANDAAATIGTVSVAANGTTNFKVTGTQPITGTTSVAIASRGLAETSLSQSGVISGTANVEATIAKIGLGVNIADNDIEVTPVIAKEDSTTAISGNITTTQPSAGHYVAVSTAAISATTNVAPIVDSEGYGTASVYGATNGEVKGGAAQSGTYYVPITAGSHTAVAAEPTVVDASATVVTNTTPSTNFDGNLTAGILSVAPAAGEYITISTTTTPVQGSVSGTVTCTSTEGYIEASEQTKSISGNVSVQVTEAANKYIKVYDGSIL